MKIVNIETVTEHHVFLPEGINTHFHTSPSVQKSYLIFHFENGDTYKVEALKINT